LLERIRYYRDVLTVNKVSAATLMNILPKFFIMYEEVKQAELRFITGQIKQGISNGEFAKAPAEKLAIALLNLSDAMKYKAEQDAVVKKELVADYGSAIKELQFVTDLIFKSLKL
jgi:hypothetical protein